MKFQDRIGDRLTELPSPNRQIFFGRWFCEQSNGLRLNEYLVSPNDVLAPGSTGNWTLAFPDTAVSMRGSFFPGALPDVEIVESLLELHEQMQGDWQEWKKISPLSPRLSETIKHQDLETHIENEFHHLASVCWKPHTHIRVETESVLVGRVRRIASNAPEWLASHTEDWDQRKINGIQPRRILAEIREEQWDLYENRVAVRLVDNLATWLYRRLDAVRQALKNIFFDPEESIAGAFLCQQRLFHLWSDDWGEGRQHAKRTEKQLEALLYRILGLKNSPLYQRISRRATVPRDLHMTNLLVNDDNYRGVARLWKHWSRFTVQSSLSPEDLYRQRQKLHQSFDAWCMLVVVRACSQLNLTPSVNSEPAIHPGCVINLSRELQLRWETSGAIRFSADGQDLLRFVPLIHTLEHAHSQEIVDEHVNSIVGAVDASTPWWTVILHPAVQEEPPYEILTGVGNPPDHKTKGAVDFIRVSPLSLVTVERVARAIQWVTLAHQMLEYPPSLSPDNQDLFVDGKYSIEGIVQMLRQPPKKKKQEDTIARQWHDACKQYEDLKKERKQAQGTSRRGPSHQDLQKAEKKISRLKAFKQELNNAICNIKAQATCPVTKCGNNDIKNFVESRDNDCFFARCTEHSCNAVWELRSDPETPHRIPVFYLRNDIENPEWNNILRKTKALPRQIEDVVGCDILAIPTIDGRLRFLPPRRDRNPLSPL